MSVSILFVILVAYVLVAAPAGLAQGDAQDADSTIMTCKDQHVLAERPNGKYTCVYKSTAERLGWTIVTVATQPDSAEPFENPLIMDGGEGTTWVQIDPVQCGGNPWGYARSSPDVIKEYYEDLGIDVF